MLGVFALILLASRSYWQQPEIPRIAQWPIGLIAIVLLQLAVNKIEYVDQGLLYILYLLFAALLMLLGARLRTCFGMEKLAIVLAVFLLIGAEISALFGVLQYYSWHTPLSAVIVMKTSAAVFGNLAQPNHYANYIALGLISLGLLFQQHKLRAVYVILLAAPLLFVMTLSGSRSSWLYMLMMSGLAWWWSRRNVLQRPLLNYSLLLMAGFVLMHLIVKLPFMSVSGTVSGGVSNAVSSGVSIAVSSSVSNAVSGGASNVTAMQRLFADDASGSVRLYIWHEAALMFAESPWLGVGFGQFAWHHFQMLPILHPNYINGLYNNAHNLIFQLAAEAGLAGLLVLFVSLGVWLYGMRRATLDAAHWWGYAALGVLAIHSLLEYPLWYTYFVAVAAILLGALDETRYRLELRSVGRMSVVAILLLGFMTLVQLRSGYRQLKDTLVISPVSGNIVDAFERTREGLIEVHGGSLLSPYAEMFMSAFAEVNADHLNEKIALNTKVMHFVPTGAVVYRQAFFLAQNGQLEQAKQVIEQAIWSYPQDDEVHKHLVSMAEKDPVHFSALLEFALQKEKEHTLAVHQ